MNTLSDYSKVGGLWEKGFTLLELLIVMAIVGLLMLVGGMNLYDAKNRNEVLNCAKRMASDIKMARRRAQGSGGRIVFMTSFDPSDNQDQGPVDLDGEIGSTGQQSDEYYIIFQDDFALGGYADSVNTRLILSGTPGDPLCDGDIVFRKESTLASNQIGDDGMGTIDVTPRGMLFFSSQGALLNFGAADKNLYLENRGQVARLQVIGLTGATRIYLNQSGYEDCGGGDCAVGTTDSAGHNPNWQPIQNTL